MVPGLCPPRRTYRAAARDPRAALFRDEAARQWYQMRTIRSHRSPARLREALTHGKIFISYRRDDSAGHAGRVHDRLGSEFGEGLLFMDVDSIQSGVDFVKVIKREVASCDILLAIIGPTWARGSDSSKKTGLHDPNDFVRIEISAALERNIPVIPIIVDDAEIPAPNMLPVDLQPLSFRNGMRVRHESFKADMQKLVIFLQTHFAAQPGGETQRHRSHAASTIVWAQTILAPGIRATTPTRLTSSPRSRA
jgi:hypothetical protein